MDLHLIFLSLIEGITEFLPISSTAHLIIFSKITSVDLTDAYIKYYLLAIQFGALLAGIFFFGKKILTDRKLLTNIIISFLPTAILGFTLYKLFKKLIEGNMILLATTMFVGGIVFIYLEKIYLEKKNTDEETKSRKSEMTKTDAFIVGVAQALAIIPGVSRSGITIIAGILIGINKSTIIEYTFLLAIPTLGSAVVYDTYKSKDLIQFSQSSTSLALGLAVSFLSGLITLYLIEKYLPKISLSAFGIYRILIALVIVATIYFS